MDTLLITLAILGYAAIAGFLWSLCCAAAQADLMAKEQRHEEPKP